MAEPRVELMRLFEAITAAAAKKAAVRESG
jgi:hypothetical protein